MKIGDIVTVAPRELLKNEPDMSITSGMILKAGHTETITATCEHDGITYYKITNGLGCKWSDKWLNIVCNKENIAKEGYRL